MNKSFFNELLRQLETKDQKNLLYTMMSILLENQKELEKTPQDPKRILKLEKREATLMRFINALFKIHSDSIEEESKC